MTATSTSAARLAGVDPPDHPLSTFGLLRAFVNNPLKAWPRALYQERLYRLRLLGREIVCVMAPDLLRAVLQAAIDRTFRPPKTMSPPERTEYAVLGAGAQIFQKTVRRGNRAQAKGRRKTNANRLRLQYQR